LTLKIAALGRHLADDVRGTRVAGRLDMLEDLCLEATAAAAITAPAAGATAATEVAAAAAVVAAPMSVKVSALLLHR